MGRGTSRVFDFHQTFETVQRNFQHLQCWTRPVFGVTLAKHNQTGTARKHTHKQTSKQASNANNKAERILNTFGDCFGSKILGVGPIVIQHGTEGLSEGEGCCQEGGDAEQADQEELEVLQAEQLD